MPRGIIRRRRRQMIRSNKPNKSRNKRKKQQIPRMRAYAYALSFLPALAKNRRQKQNKKNGSNIALEPICSQNIGDSVGRYPSNFFDTPRKRSSRELAPAEILHVLVLVLARPHDLALQQRVNVRNGGYEPHDDEEDRERAADAVDTGAVQCGADLDGGEG